MESRETVLMNECRSKIICYKNAVSKTVISINKNVISNNGASKTIQAGHFLSPEVRGTCGQDLFFFFFF